MLRYMQHFRLTFECLREEIADLYRISITINQKVMFGCFLKKIYSHHLISQYSWGRVLAQFSKFPNAQLWDWLWVSAAQYSDMCGEWNVGEVIVIAPLTDTQQYKQNQNIILMQFTDFKNLSRYDSQQLNYELPHNEKQQQEGKNKDYRTQLDQLLLKIADMFPDSTPTKPLQPQKRNSQDKIKSIMREGKPQDEAHKPSVLETSISKKMKNRNSSNCNPKQRDNKQTSPHKNDQFYKFWTDQMVRLTNENNQLKKTINKNMEQIEKQNKAYQNLTRANEQLNSKINQISSRLAEKSEELDIYKQKINKENEQLQKKMNIQVQNFQTSLKNREKQLQNSHIFANQREAKIKNLMNENKMLKINESNIEVLMKQNINLKDRINRLVGKIQILEKNNGKKCEEVKHLWKIKEIEYENIINLINKGKARE